MDVQLKRGALEPLVLSAMLKGETYGYELIKKLSPVIDISESTLYPILRRLEADRRVSVKSVEHNGRLRKYYSITPLGRERIKEFLEDWKSVAKACEYIEREYEND